MPNTAQWRWGIIKAVFAKLMPLEYLLKKTWNPARYNISEPLDGSVELSEAEKQEPNNLDYGLLTRTIHCPMFWKYGNMVERMHSIPDSLASWGEGCPCHDFKTNEDSFVKSAVRQVKSGPSEFPEHARDGLGTPCMLRTRRALECADKAYMRFLEQAYNDEHHSVSVSMGHLDSKYQEILLSDMAIFKAELFRILKQKLHFGECLPWLLAGVCHGDSSIGRRIARECVAAFDVVNAGEEHHHRIAWKVLGPESPLRRHLLDFIAGDPLSAELLDELLPLALVPIVERAVEAQHSLIHRQAATRRVSGPYVSNSLRLGVTKDMLKKGKKTRLAFYRSFEDAKVSTKVIQELGISKHPAIQAVLQSGAKKKSERLFKIIGDVVYSLDETSQFASYRTAHKENKSAQKKKKASLTREVKNRKRELKKPLEDAGRTVKRQRTSANQMLTQMLCETSAAEHFAETLQCGSIISVPAHVSGFLECMDDCLASPFHKVLRGQVQQPEQPLRQIAVCLEDDVDVPLAGDVELAAEQQLPNCDQLLFFKVLKIGAGKSKTLQVMPAYGEKLKHFHVTATVHRVVELDYQNSRCILEGRTAATSAKHSIIVFPLQVLSSAEVRPHVKLWSAPVGSLQHCIIGCEGDPVCRRVVTRMVSKSCVAGSNSFVGALTEEERACLQRLHARGFIDSNGSSQQYQLSTSGCKSLTYVTLKDHVKDVFPTEVLRPLKDASKYELVLHLISEKWSFQKHWSKNKGLPPPYLTDPALASEKIAYVTGVQTSKEYLQVLATADALRAKKGLLVVQHQQPQKHYKELLRTGKARAQMVLMPDGEEYCTQDNGPQHHGMCGDDDHSEEGSAESDGGRHEGLLQDLLQAESHNETESACSDDSIFDLEKSLGQAIEGANASLDNEHEPLEEDLGPSATEVVADEEEVVPAVPSDSDLLKNKKANSWGRLAQAGVLSKPAPLS